jgi:magnesium-transporting ATPase (P-type)
VGYVLSIINSSSDRFMANHADITIGLEQKYRSSDSLALSDLNVSELHSLTYIMFKHATILHRRSLSVIKFFLHRTVLLFVILTIFVGFSGLSWALPYESLFLIFFSHIFTPIQYFMFGISQKDYGYD